MATIFGTFMRILTEILLVRLVQRLITWVSGGRL